MRVLALVTFLCVSLALGAQRSLFEIEVAPRMTVPLGEDADVFSIGGGINVGGAYPLPFWTNARALASIGYELMPLVETDVVKATA